MKLILRNTIFTVVCGLLLLTTVSFAQNNSAKKIVFPEVEGWEKGEINTYPTAEPGYSVPYQSDTGGIVTFYVYKGGFSKIADGIDDQNVKNEIKKAENDIQAYGKAGYYQEVKLVKSDSVILG